MQDSAFPPAGLSISDIHVGMSASRSHRVSDDDIRTFARLSGDRNPVHLDEEFASGSRFKRRIAHGLFSAGLFSAIFGTELPGVGCVYVSQNLNFKRPVYMDDEVTASVVVTEVDMAKHRVSFDTVCKVNNKVVIDGTAVLYLPPQEAGSGPAAQ